jgi:uncharacterized phiE125 gp8 family phage protein
MMSTGGAVAGPIATLSEAQAFTRVETGEEEAVLAGLIRTASALCEAFLGQVVIERSFTEVVPASSQGKRLQVLPVRTITEVASGGMPVPLAAYAADIDSSGCGWVRITDPAVSGIVEVRGTAGLAASQNAVPEPIRQGVLRLVGHLFGSRDGDGGEIPAAVTALWRPYRRMRLK